MTKLTNDSMRSFVAGLGDPLRDKMATAHYGISLLTDLELTNAYNNSWLARKIIDIPCYDAIKKGRLWQAEADQIEAIEREERRLDLWHKILDAMIKARLYGGSVIYIGTDDVDVSLPLDPTRLKRDGIKFLTVLSRREIAAGQLDQDALSPNYGKPEYYEVTTAGLFARIHPSRLAVFNGSKQADIWTAIGPNYGWGNSVLQSIYSALKNADATTANIASLVFEANVDVFGVPDLMSNMSDPEYGARLIERFNMAATAKGINRALIRDAAETYDRKQVNFGGLPELINTFMQHVSGASDIPVTRLLGQSPGGLNSTGEFDIENYYDKVSSIQALDIDPAINTLNECIIKSALGSRPPEIFYTWVPLGQTTEKEKAEIGKLHAETASILIGTGLFVPEELRTVVSNQLIETSFYPGLDQIMDGTGEEFDLDSEDIIVPSIENETKVISNVVEGNESIQRLALNGAQVTALREMIVSVSRGELPEESAIILIQNAFPAISRDQIVAMLKPMRGFNARVQPEE